MIKHNRSCGTRLSRLSFGLCLIAFIASPAAGQDSGIFIGEGVTTSGDTSMIDPAASTGSSDTNIGPDAPVIDMAPISMALPTSALKDDACPRQFNEQAALTLSQLNALPGRAGQGPLSDKVCYGSSWRISKGDGVRQPNVTVAFSPGQTLCEDGSCTGRQFKSEVKLGLDTLGIAGEAPTGWFLFAGADDKAMMWRARNDRAAAQDSRLVLEDSLMVGDIEAGLSYVHRRGEIAVSYIHRETSYRVDQQEKLSDSSGYVGVVFRVK
ncbi:MAG: hypothetical protein ACWA5T_07130 [Parvularcula sp.]